MSAPITHIVLSEKIFDKYFFGSNKREFIIGTSFPDIRHLGNIGKSDTHFKNITLKSIYGESAFVQGLKFHSLVDEVMIDFRKRKNIFSFFPNSRFVKEAEKAFEDIVLYEKLHNRKNTIHLFDDVLADELKFGVEEDVVKKWHLMLQDYIGQLPNYKSAIEKLVIGPKGISEEIVKIVRNISNRKKAAKLIEDFYDNFESVIA